MQEMILILDFGSQYTQLIARRIREQHVYCEIVPWNKIPKDLSRVKGVILSGSPFSVLEEGSPKPDLSSIKGKFPLLGVCYGAQLMAWQYGGKVARSDHREYGRAHLGTIDSRDPFLAHVHTGSQVWMSHADSILECPAEFELLAGTTDVPVAAYRIRGEKTYGIQFHPEVTHSLEGRQIIRNFVVDICGCSQSWTPLSFIEDTVAQLKKDIPANDQVVMGLSGGVDSTVAAMLLHRAIGKRLHCIFVDNGLLRKNEFEQVLDSYQHMGLNIKGVDAGKAFLRELKGQTDPEAKRKAIGRVFIEVFEQESRSIKGAAWLGQGTIYPDVIESVSVHGPSVTIKSHHNVGGLPERMNMKVVEPLRLLFKDEVREVGLAMGIDPEIIGRHPFPGPGLGIRVLGEVSEEKLRILKEADDIYISGLKEEGLYAKVWQAGAMLLPVQSVGVMGDERTYEFVVALRAVESRDGMTADWSQLPYEFLGRISSRIINRVKGINRVVYDISSKPPATIEWE